MHRDEYFLANILNVRFTHPETLRALVRPALVDAAYLAFTRYVTAFWHGFQRAATFRPSG